MSVKRRDLLRYFESQGFHLLRDGAIHSIFTNGQKAVPIKHHGQVDRITANELCKQAAIPPKY